MVRLRNFSGKEVCQLLAQNGFVLVRQRGSQAESAHWQQSPDFHFTLGDLLLDWALHDPQRAPQLLPRIESSWLRAVAIGERTELQDSVSGRGSWLAAHNLAMFHESLGHAADARHWRAQQLRMQG